MDKKPVRFTQKQIIRILREQEAGQRPARFAASTGSQRYFLQMEGQVRRPGSVCCQAAEDPGRRERQPEEAVGGSDASTTPSQGYRFKKLVTSAAQREAVAHLRSEFEVSERRGADRTSVRYRSRRSNDGAIRVRWRALAIIRPPAVELPAITGANSKRPIRGWRGRV